MKKILNLGLAILLFMSGVVFADEGPSAESKETLQPNKGKVADEGVGIGPEKLWRISPGFKYSTAYDSNVNREPHGKQDQDVIMNFVPSIAMSRVGSQFGVLSDYEMNYQLYLRDSNQSGFNHRFHNKMWYESERLKMKVDESFGWIKTYATSEQSERRTILFNDVTPEVIYDLGAKTSFSAIYNNYLFDYRDSALKSNSYIQHDFGGRVYYDITDKTKIFAQGSAILTDYYRSDLYNSHGYGVYGGAIGKVTDKTVLNLKTGFEHRAYDDSTINSFNNWVGEIAARHNLTAKTDVTLTAKREIQESVYQNTGWYRFDRIGIEFEHRITSKITAQIGGDFQSNHYPRETEETTLLKKRRDYLIMAHSRLKWEPIRNLILAVGYIFSNRNSNFDEFDYIDHLVEASTSFRF